MPYAPSAEPLTRLADGTVKQISPFTGTEVWTVPGRANRPISHPVAEVRPLDEADRTRSCAFCSARYLDTPPEKARVVRRADGGSPTIGESPSAQCAPGPVLPAPGAPPPPFRLRAPRRLS